MFSPNGIVLSSNLGMSELNLNEKKFFDENFDFYVDMYEIYFEDEEPVEWGTWIGEGDILCPGASFSIEIVTGYKDDAPRVPYMATTISDLGVEFNFAATDQNLCDGDTPITPNKDN